MNAKLLASALIAAVGFATAPSFAADNGEVGYVNPVAAVQGGLSRRAAQAEYLQAQRNDVLPQVGEGADVAAMTAIKSELSRDAVRAEAMYAVRHGQQVVGEV